MKFQTTSTGRIIGDPRGAHVTMRYHGRTILGEVVRVRVEDSEGERIRVLDVRYFNGEPWPVSPYFMAVEVLEREYEEED